jgi:hypothetical protein
MLLSHLSPGNGPIFEAAHGYARRGWSIIPTIHKVAAGTWKAFQERPANEAILRQMFGRGRVTGLAVVLGNVSGGLACRDYDDDDAYYTWAASHPNLAAVLPTVRTSRGYHVYFIGPEGFSILGDGEYRADSGHYCLLPPSLHPDGSMYRWFIPLPTGELPTLDPVEAGLVPAFEPGMQDTDQPITNTETQATQATQATHATHCMCPSFSIEIENSIECIIAKTLPTGPGQRNRRLFALARQLKAILPDASNEALRAIVRRWFARALPNITTKAWCETWEDFANAWVNVKAPVDAVWNAIVEKATTLPLPVGFENAAAELVRLCAALHSHHGHGKPWPLSCRKAADAIGVGRDKAARLLKLLRFEGVIALITRAGPRSSRRAAEYRFLSVS